jgi:hypothetical protein
MTHIAFFEKFGDKLWLKKLLQLITKVTTACSNLLSKQLQSFFRLFNTSETRSKLKLFINYRRKSTYENYRKSKRRISREVGGHSVLSKQSGSGREGVCSTDEQKLGSTTESEEPNRNGEPGFCDSDFHAGISMERICEKRVQPKEKDERGTI